MQYGYLAFLAATLAGTSTATQYGGSSSNMGSEQNNNNMGNNNNMMSSGNNNKMMSNEQQMQPQQKQQQQYQPPPGSCWQGMSQVQDMKQQGIVIISNNDGGMNNKWNMVSQKNNYMPSSSNCMTHQVTVGGSKGLIYDPPTINAKPCDMVQFNFMDKNHTVTQSTFDKPCVKMMGGMDSGFMPNPGNMVNPAPAMKVQVMDTKPMWFYCKQKMPKPHCGSGMAFSINPTMEKSQDMFVKAAMAQNGTGSMMAPPPPPPPPSNVAMPQSNVVQGMGSMQNGQCTCQCLCGSNQYAAGLGIGQMGGIGGMISAMPAPSSGGDSKAAMPPAPPAMPAMPAMPASQGQPGVADGA